MDVRLGDTLLMKKKHPCGCDKFAVLRIGADFRIKCNKNRLRKEDGFVVSPLEIVSPYNT